MFRKFLFTSSQLAYLGKISPKRTYITGRYVSKVVGLKDANSCRVKIISLPFYLNSESYICNNPYLDLHLYGYIAAPRGIYFNKTWALLSELILNKYVIVDIWKNNVAQIYAKPAQSKYIFINDNSPMLKIPQTVDVPQSFPLYANNIKQLMKVNNFIINNAEVKPYPGAAKFAPASANWTENEIKYGLNIQHV